ncbi:MAG: hypothetical protein ACJAXX_001180 [Roseivirga sp.]
MRILVFITLFVLSSFSVISQVTMRDTLILWQHFDYEMDENFSLANYSESDIVTTEFEGIVLENELVKICLIPAFGARIISFVYKPSGLEQLYQNPIGTPYQIGSNIFYHDWLMVYGGIFPTFPESEHGKYWNTPWNYEITEQSDDKITVSMWLKDELDNPKRPSQYNNGVTGITCYFNVSLEVNKPFFKVDVELENDASSDRYEYWTCITFAPGSEIGNTFTPSNTEMIVPIDHYEVGWNPNNWLNSLDEVVRAAGPRVQVYDKLAHLSNWRAQGIAYAYPTMEKDFYGVINHENENGLFRLSSDQTQTPGLKFWTWGDTQGLAADPNNFNNEARPYIEMWSGVSQQFFKDAFLAANESVQWTETYLPTVGVPSVSFMNEEIAFGSSLNESELKVHAFLPISTDSYTLEIKILEGTNEVYSETQTIALQTLDASFFDLNLTDLNLTDGSFEVKLSMLKNATQLYTESYLYEVNNSSAFEPRLTVTNGAIQLAFEDAEVRTIYLHDLYGRRINRVVTSTKEASVSYPEAGVYLINIVNDKTRWSKKISIR